MLPPRIDTSRLKHPVLAKLACPVTLSVDVSGYPRPSVRWFIGRREVRDGDGLQLTVDGRRYDLHVDDVTDDLARGVTVIAANSIGVITSEIPVKVYKVLRSQNFLQRSISQTLRSPDSVVLQRRRKLRLIRPGQSLSSFGSFSSFQYDNNVSRTFSERPRRPSTADSLLSEGSGHWPSACSPRHTRRVFDFELQNLPSSPPSGRRFLSSGDPDVSFECIQEPSERTVGGRRRYQSDAVFDDVRARAPIASTPEVHTLDFSPTPPGRVSPPPTEVTPARLRPVRSKPPPAPPTRSSSLVSSPSSTATECTASTQRSPRQTASPSPRRETNGVIPSTTEGIVNPAFHPSVSLEKQVSEFFAPSAMEPEGDDNDDIWRLMGFKLSELCRVMLKDPAEAEDEPTEEREVRPLSTSTGAEPIRERQSQRNDAVGRTSRDVGAAVIANDHTNDTGIDFRTVSVIGSVSGISGDKVLLNHSGSVRVTNTGSQLKDSSNDTPVTDTQQNGSNEGGGVISSRSGKKQKSSKSRDAKEKKKGKKHKKVKKDLPCDSGSHKASEQNILRQEIAATSVIPTGCTTTESTSISAATDTHDVMYSEGIIEIANVAHNNGLDLPRGYTQENSVEENQPIGGAATGLSRSSEVEEILQHKQEVDKYVREINTQHDLTYGNAVAATSDDSKSDVITTDGSDVKLSGDSPKDKSSVHSDGSSTVATAETVTTADVTPPGASDTLPGSYIDPVRRPARTKRGKLRQIVELNQGSEEHRIVEIQVVPASCDRTDIQALIESTEAINVDALVDESLRQCLTSMTFSRPDYRPCVEDSDTDVSSEREDVTADVPVKRRKHEEAKNESDIAERQGCSSPTTTSYEGDFTQQEPRPDQWDLNRLPGMHVDPEDMPTSGDQLELGCASNEGSGEADVHQHKQVRSPADTDQVTDVVWTPVHVDTETRRASESLSDDILFDEGFRVDDARELEMDAVSDEISLTSFNTVIAVEAAVTNTEPTQADLDVTVDELMQAAERLQTNHSSDGREAMTDAISVDRDDAAPSTPSVATNVSTASVALEKTGDVGAVKGTTDDNFENGELSTDASVRKGGRAYTRSSSLPQSDRSDRFEYDVRSPVVETTRPASSKDGSPLLSRSSSTQQVDRCDSFECEVRKQLQRPDVTSGDPPFDDADPCGPEAGDPRTRSPASFSRDSTTPESDNSAEIELKIVESDDDGDIATVAATSRDTHARLYTLENTSDDYDVTRSHDNSDANGLNHEETDSDIGSDLEGEAANFYTADGREKTARAQVSDVIAFNENAGHSNTHTYSGGSVTSSQTDNDSDAKVVEDDEMARNNNVGESTDVIARNGDAHNDVIIDKETNVSCGVTTDEINEHSAGDRRDDVTTMSATEGIIRGACGHGTMVSFQDDQTFQRAAIPHGCSNMITPIIVITEYCDPTPGGVSYDCTFDLDDCQSGACDMNVDDNITSVENVSEDDHFSNQDNSSIYENTKEPLKDGGGENRRGSTGGSDPGKTTPDKQPGAPDDDADVELLTSDNDDVVSDNKENNASADVSAVDVSEPEDRRCHVGGAVVAAATTSEGATSAEQTLHQMAPNPPDSAAVLPRQPEAASAMIGTRRQDFLSDLLVEKACLEGFFSNIGSLAFLLLAVFIFHLMDIFSRNYSPD